MLDAIELLKPETVDAHRRTYQCRVFLGVFWQKAKKATNKRKRLSLLRVFAGLVLGEDPYREHSRSWGRRHFEKNKHRIVRLEGCCWVCELRPESRHHVIQVQHGGRNTAQNIVKLCDRCHGAVHATGEEPDEWPQIDFTVELSRVQSRRKRGFGGVVSACPFVSTPRPDGEVGQ